MKYIPFWTSPKLSKTEIGKLPPNLRLLLKSSKFTHLGGGPRTLDSVISYMPMFKQKKITNIRSQFKYNNSQIKSSNTNVNIIVCLSQRDFPVNIHQRLLVLLSMRGIDLNKIQWVITNVDQLESYPMFPETPKSLNESNIQLWTQKFRDELNTYLQYFIQEKIHKKINDELKSDYFQTSVEYVNSNGYDLINRLKDYNVPLENVHLYSTELPWTLSPILESLDYDPIQCTNTYIIGQTNSGKSSLTRNIIRSFKNDYEDDENHNLLKNNYKDAISSPDSVKLSPTPFSSKFNVYNIPGMKIIDTPGYVRKNGSIWGHLKENALFLLRIPPKDKLSKPKSLTIYPKILKANGNSKDVLSRINLGHLVLIKPWLILPKPNDMETGEAQEHNGSISMEVKVFLNMPGAAKAITAKEMDDELWNNSLVSQKQWSRYLVAGKRVELVLDNVGSFTLETEKIPEVAKVYWEINIPQNIRFLSRSWDNENNVKFENYYPIKGKCSKLLEGIQCT